MKILLYISDITLGGGTERAGISIANALSRLEGNQVAIVTLSAENEPTRFQVSEDVKIKSLGLKGRPIKLLPKIIFGIRKYVKEFSPDVFVSNEVMSVYFSLPAVKTKGKEIKYIVWEHFNFNITLGKKGREVARKISARFADFVVTLTEKDKQLWEEKLNPTAKVVCIPNPSPFHNLKNPYESSSKTIIAIGHLIPVKGFDLLIDSWKILKDNYEVSGWKQLIIGDGIEKETLRQKVNELGLGELIEFVPATTQIENYYRNASFIVMTSRTEGLPMTLIEAQQFGLPAISFYNDEVMYGVKDIVDEKSGVLVPQFDLELFAEKMNLLIQNETVRANYSNNSFVKSRNFNSEIIVKEWQKLLEH